ncbi:MAG TPA: hypothetical protein VG371_16510 [Solirubrobacteraceae bacterium]|jgi:hypothetical protein|nr:hypothetical protein [Solirubrobacteraceae bacterium]
MAHRQENSSSEPDETRIRKLGGAFTAALLSGDAVEAVDAMVHRAGLN